MGRGLCNADQGGYNVIWEAGTEGTDSVKTGGAVAKCVWALHVLWLWVSGEQSAKSEGSPAFGSELSCPLLLQRQGEGVLVVESLGWESRQAVAGGRKQKALAQLHRASVCFLFPLRGWGRKLLCTERTTGFGLASETSCDRRTECILRNGGVEESPWSEYFEGEEQGRTQFQGRQCLTSPVCIFTCSPGFGSHTVPFHLP